MNDVQRQPIEASKDPADDAGRFFIMPDDAPICAGHVWHASVISWWTKTAPQRRCFLVEVVHIDHTLLVADVCYLEERMTRAEAEDDLRKYVAPPFLYGDVVWRAFEPTETGEPKPEPEPAAHCDDAHLSAKQRERLESFSERGRFVRGSAELQQCRKLERLGLLSIVDNGAMRVNAGRSDGERWWVEITGKGKEHLDDVEDDDHCCDDDCRSNGCPIR